MKMSPVKGSRFEKKGLVEVEKSPCGKGKLLIQFEDGSKCHLPESELSKFYEMPKAPKPKKAKPKAKPEPKEDK